VIRTGSVYLRKVPAAELCVLTVLLLSVMRAFTVRSATGSGERGGRRCNLAAAALVRSPDAKNDNRGTHADCQRIRRSGGRPNGPAGGAGIGGHPGCAFHGDTADGGRGAVAEGASIG